jgi:hypothetical protein
MTEPATTPTHCPTPWPTVSTAHEVFVALADGGVVVLDRVAVAAVDPVAVGRMVAGSRVASEANAAETPLAFLHALGMLLETPATKVTAAHCFRSCQ